MTPYKDFITSIFLLCGQPNAGSWVEAPNFKIADVILDEWSGLPNTSRRGERWVWNNGGKSEKTLLRCHFVHFRSPEIETAAPWRAADVQEAPWRAATV